jgi:hypothetical protein
MKGSRDALGALGSCYTVSIDDQVALLRSFRSHLRLPRQHDERKRQKQRRGQYGERIPDLHPILRRPPRMYVDLAPIIPQCLSLNFVTLSSRAFYRVDGVYDHPALCWRISAVTKSIP